MITKAILLGLVPRLLVAPGLPVHAAYPQSHSVWARSDRAADTILAVVEQEVPEAKREKFARLAFTWSRFEAFWHADPPGLNDKKGVEGTPGFSEACGPLQSHTPWLFVEGATCKKVRADLTLGYRVGIRIMLKLEKDCGGSLKEAMTAFSTDGSCHPKWDLDLVKRRFKLAGVEYK